MKLVSMLLISQLAMAGTTFDELKSRVVAQGISSINICGNDRIHISKASINSNFQINGSGYFLTNAPSTTEYFKLLGDYRLADVKSELQKRFGRVHLFKYNSTSGVQDLGAPANLVFNASRTVKDCLESGKGALEQKCSAFSDRERLGCCREKFPGPVFKFKNDASLFFSPDPSVQLKVTGESKHRFCDIEQELRF